MISEYRSEIVLVEEDDRLNFLPSLFNNDILLFMAFENTVFNVARSVCKSYDGGYWEYYRFYSNGGFMALDEADSFEIFNCWGKYYTFNGTDFGLIASLKAVIHLMEHVPRFKDNKFLLRAYTNLMSLVADRKDNEEILDYLRD